MDAFLLKLALSFVIGGGYIAFTMWVSEKFGSKIGGIAIGLPSTALISLLFIAWTQDAAAAVVAVTVIPAALSVSSLFIVAFLVLNRFGVLRALVGSIALWLVLLAPLALLHVESLLFSLVFATILFPVSLSYLHRFPDRRAALVASRRQFLFRAVGAGLVVAVAVFLGKALGPLWGGLFAAFPAAFSSSLVLLVRDHGAEFTAAVAKTMPYGALANVAFAVAFFFMVPATGIGIGVIGAYLLSVVAGLLLYRFG